nr:hypothetical protein [uncultured Draconibacterium sp.]
MKQILTCTLLVITFLANGQRPIEKLESGDIQAALNMNGIEIFKYDISKKTENSKLIIHLDEIANDSIIKSKSYNFGKLDSAAKIKDLRIISYISSDTASVYWMKIGYSIMETKIRFDIPNEFRNAHYWLEIEPGEIEYNKKTPLVFCGLSWESEMNGMKFRRFCWGAKVDREMKNKTLKNVKHMILISYELIE